jgi:hypothetical protein
VVECCVIQILEFGYLRDVQVAYLKHRQFSDGFKPFGARLHKSGTHSGAFHPDPRYAHNARLPPSVQ